MFAFLSDFFEKKLIDCWAPVPLSACRVTKPYLLERANISDGTVIIIAVPYFTKACADKQRNISAYAVSKNYHDFFINLFDELILLLQANFPNQTFASFADHSPIAEIEAAALAGLGVIGQNHLLLTPKYSSYIFLGEIITDAILPCDTQKIQGCENCGACQKSCPMEDCGTCLSALTQKKGELSEREAACIVKYGSAWGCDICQEVCPHTKRALKSGSIFTPIPYFYEDNISHLTTLALDAMSDEAFVTRAFSWRGRNTVRRNLLLLENHFKEKGDEWC
ncbi:MAG: epoxyqueuosine reductase [Clostridia bacterium]|nr:epoxyqueuosine reductase [Clostridia bacterium]